MGGVVIIIIVVLIITLGVFVVHGYFEFTNAIGLVPLPRRVLDRVIRELDLKPGDRLLDLGCGDGRVVRAATRAGAAASGVDNNPIAVLLAKLRGAQVRRGDLFAADVSGVTIVFVYLHPSINARVAARLARGLAPGSRVASMQFELSGWSPTRVVELDGPPYANKLWLYSLDKIRAQGGRHE